MNVVAFQQPAADRFDEFWRVCVKKVGRPLAKAKFDAITSPEGMTTKTLDRDSGAYVPIHLKATPDELIEGMKRYARTQIGPDYKLKDGGKYTLHPASFLNQGRWLDE